MTPLHRRTICVIALLLATSTTNTSAAEWKAGVAKGVITPTEPMWMAGYASRNKPAEGTLHDLWAKALVIEDPAGRRQILVTLDLIGIGRALSAGLCERLQKENSVDRSQIAISTSHTHTGPVVGRNLQTMYFLNDVQKERVEKYASVLVNTISDIVAQAVNNLEPSTLTLGRGSANFAVNRRNNREADVPKLRQAGELKGPVDHIVPVLSVNTMDGKRTAIVFGYACHATVLSFYQWSGDWPGFAQIEIERRHPETVAMFVTGCGADQNPLPRRTVELAEDYGRQMADAVDDVLNEEMEPVRGRLMSAYKEIPLKLGTLPTRDELVKSLESRNKYVVSRATNLLLELDSRGQLNQFYDAYPIQTWGIGDARVVFLGGEVVVDYALRIPADFDQHNVWVAGYANDIMAYIPSKRVLMEGGYEGESSMIYYGLPTKWDPSVEETIVDEAGRQLNELANAQQ